MKENEIIEAVYNAAFNYIHSVVPAKHIHDLDISIGLEDKELIIDITLVTDRSEEADQRTVNDALGYAFEKADELMKNIGT